MENIWGSGQASATATAEVRMPAYRPNDIAAGIKQPTEGRNISSIELEILWHRALIFVFCISNICILYFWAVIERSLFFFSLYTVLTGIVSIRYSPYSFYTVLLTPHCAYIAYICMTG